MSFDKEIGAPFTLASLPKSIGQSHGRTHAASVCSINGTKKRKRTEIAVGLDGEGISIYSLQNPHLATSYALPPQTSFTSAPYSIYRKGSTKRQPRRYTYALVAESTSGAKAQLVCFAEETRADGTTDTTKSTYTPSTTSQTVIAIDVLPVPSGGSQKDPSHDVLVVFDGGEVICLSADLEVVRWVASLRSLAPSKEEDLWIEHASLSTAKAVIRGLLRSRQDIAAILNPSLDDISDLLDLTQVLCVVSRRAGNHRTLGLFQLHPRSPDLPASHLPPPKHLSTWDIPSSPSTTSSDSRSPTHSIHANTGALHSLTDEGLLSYDFSGTVPKFTSQLPVEPIGAVSFLRISQDLMFIASPKSCRVLDSKYNSIQATLNLESSRKSAVRDSKKRKHTESETVDRSSNVPALVSYYADLGQAVGIWRDEVVGFQLEGSLTRKRIKTDGMRLIDSLGKGLSPKGTPVGKETHDWQKWQDKTAKLDRYASKGKIAKFEELFASDLGIELEGQNDQEQGGTLSNLTNGDNDTIMVNGDTHAGDASEDLPRKWRLEKASLHLPSLEHHRDYALYSLNRIFRWVESPPSERPRGCLKIDFFPPNVFQWLLSSGYLTKESIRRAISEHSPAKLDLTAPITDGDITRAIVDFDPELHILSAMLNQSHFLPIGEVVEAIKLIMQGLDDQPRTEDANKLLTNGVHPAADEMEVEVASELEAASHEIDRALAILDDGISIRNNTLRPALIRLHTFPPPVVSSTLRSMLRRHDLESLVRLLHHEFKNGGWASQHDTAEPESPAVELSSEEADDSAVVIIASLLSCTIDAIGPATWLAAIGGSGQEDPTEDLILDLSEATSIAITGFWEARYIRGLVTELLRYASKIPKSHKRSSKTLEKQGKPFALDLKPDDLPMLPMGSKPDPGVEKTKAGKGGKKKERSAREMGMLISQRVPKYSFERIVM
ncbi:hypothetical protein K458DRAFT_371944 [Lentithecium fluviatile CBS 122367]|uniref:Utp8 beta-propeller domain-containing protein n=1 Tax=Lentithecium fluviatile CBS 122367 TaxID=1168545 RepID=A0A6G1IU82_9PLEO|nr:hypothetical protein K458DRAFT_371944 [Lentithecium fluviatile CBS 122367]